MSKIKILIVFAPDLLHTAWTLWPAQQLYSVRMSSLSALVGVEDRVRRLHRPGFTASMVLPPPRRPLRKLESR